MDGLSIVHFDMESIVSNIVTFLENCQSIGDSLGLPMDVVSTVLDDTLDGISLFKSVKAMASIPDQLFLIRLNAFLSDWTLSMTNGAVRSLLRTRRS